MAERGDYRGGTAAFAVETPRTVTSVCTTTYATAPTYGTYDAKAEQSMLLRKDGTPTRAEGPGKWRHSLLGCFSDWSVCCAVFCCSAVTTSQIYERAVRAGLVPRASCLGCCGRLGCCGMFVVLLVLYSLHSALEVAAYNDKGAWNLKGNFYWRPRVFWESWFGARLDLAALDEHGSGGGKNATEGDEGSDIIPGVEIERVSTPWELKLAQSCLLVGQMLTCAVVCGVRRAIRRRDKIALGPLPCSDCCEDCCCALCCNPCSQCLLLRHEGATDGRYSLCSPVAVNV